jgi:tRNA(fMet)-specific endonuclease VapC
MIYLLNTNACIALINGTPPHVRLRLEQAIKQGDSVAVPTVAAFELWYGAAKSAGRHASLRRLETFFAGPLELVAFDDQDARRAGQLRATLERSGRPIGAYDLLVAGQALRYEATLVTANASEFSRVAGLRWEDWASPT